MYTAQFVSLVYTAPTAYKHQACILQSEIIIVTSYARYVARYYNSTHSSTNCPCSYKVSSKAAQFWVAVACSTCEALRSS